MRSLILLFGIFCSVAGATIPSPAPPAPRSPPAAVVVEVEKPVEVPEFKFPKLDDLIEYKCDPAPAVPKPDYGCFVYPIRIRGYLASTGEARFRTGSAVSAGGGKFLATAHDVEGLRPGYVVEFQIGEAWHMATSVKVEREADTLEAAIARTDVAGVNVRKQEYGEPVTVYGLTTCKPMNGRAYAEVVGLEPDEPGVQSGDSGGGVFAKDGSLVGLVSGYGADHRSVVISRLGEPAPLSVSAKQPTPAVVAPRQYAPVPSGTVCQNGQCWRTAPAGTVCRNGQCWKR